MSSFDEIDEDIMYDEKRPILHKLLEVTGFIPTSPRGIIVGKLAKQYKNMKKGTMVYLKYHKEFHVFVFDLYETNIHVSRLESVEHILFDDVIDLSNHLKQFQIKEDRYLYLKEEISQGSEYIFDKAFFDSNSKI